MSLARLPRRARILLVAAAVLAVAVLLSFSPVGDAVRAVWTALVSLLLP